MVNLPLLLARRYVSRQKGSFSAFIIKLAIVATALSVAVMILSVSVIGGFKTEIRDKLYSFWGHVLLLPYTDNPSNIIASKPLHYDAALVQNIRRDARVESMAAFIVRPAIIQYNGQMEGLKLKGVDRHYSLPEALHLQGSPIAYTDTDYSKDVIISATTASRLRINRGDAVLFYFLEKGATTPRIRKLRVSGIYHTGMEDVDQYLAICDIRLLQHINNWQPQDINGYQLSVRKEADAAPLADEIYNNTDLSAQTIQQTFPGITDWLAVQDTSVSILMIIMSIVSVISMGAALIILIVERAAVIGLLKALGLNNAGSQKVFLYIALLTGGLGIVLGNVLALGLCIAQQKIGFLKLAEADYFMDKVPVKIHLGYILLIDLATLLVTVLCMWLPTLYVRRMQPARVLRFK